MRRSCARLSRWRTRTTLEEDASLARGQALGAGGASVAVAALGEAAPPDYGECRGRDADAGARRDEPAQLAAISRHVSQTGSAGPFHDWSAEMRDGYLATEHYRLAASNLPVPAGSGATEPEQSIWDGLPRGPGGADTTRVASVQGPSATLEKWPIWKGCYIPWPIG